MAILRVRACALNHLDLWDGRLWPAIDQVLPLSEVARAHQRLEDRRQFGKIVLTPKEPDPATGRPTDSYPRSL
jgi:hypothetical protein